MRCIVLSGILWLPIAKPASDSAKESLRTARARTRDSAEKLRLYRDLADVSYDTGCDIPSDKYGQVFVCFAKLDSYKSGSGLGLYLCRLIVRRFSGIRAEPGSSLLFPSSKAGS